MTGEVPAAVSDAHPQWQDRSQPITVEFGPSSRFLVRILPANRLKLAETADRRSQPAAGSDAPAAPKRDRSQPITVEFGPSSRFRVRILPANRLQLEW
jgi:hypothetical protein